MESQEHPHTDGPFEARYVAFLETITHPPSEPAPLLFTDERKVPRNRTPPSRPIRLARRSGGRSNTWC